ncbi:hypothetical protein OG780_01640 [Streptomyces sp. NBC_00386]|jgi:hypothetical protein|uniref:hypothetical protein n=1 Tax=Streptomyces sp. NBC_00386 TaxID=2975734 RepID=UPI002E1F1283
MPHLSPTIRRVPRKAGPVAAPTALLALGLTLTPAAASNTDDTKTAGPRPTIVLEHGAFADASGWNDVIHSTPCKNAATPSTPRQTRCTP